MAPSISDGDVTLQGGPSVPIESWALALDLEARGFELTTDGHTLTVRPSHQLTDEDRRAIRRFKPHLVALVSYVAPGAQ